VFSGLGSRVFPHGQGGPRKKEQGEGDRPVIRKSSKRKGGRSTLPRKLLGNACEPLAWGTSAKRKERLCKRPLPEKKKKVRRDGPGPVARGRVALMWLHLVTAAVFGGEEARRPQKTEGKGERTGKYISE